MSSCLGIDSSTQGWQDTSHACPVEDLVVYLCAHATKHCWERVGWLCDVAQVCRTQTHLDWDVVLYRCRELRLERVMRVAMGLMRDLLESGVPPEVVDQLGEDPVADFLIRQVRRQVGSVPPLEIGALSPPPSRLRVRETLTDSVAYPAYYATALMLRSTTVFRRWWGETPSRPTR